MRPSFPRPPCSEEPEVPRAVPAVEVERVLLDRAVALERVHEVDVRGRRHAEGERVGPERPLEPQVLEVRGVDARRLEVALAVRLQPHAQRQRLRQRVVVGEVDPADPEAVLVHELVTVVLGDVVVVTVHEAADLEGGGRRLLGLRRGRRWGRGRGGRRLRPGRGGQREQEGEQGGRAAARAHLEDLPSQRPGDEPPPPSICSKSRREASDHPGMRSATRPSASIRKESGTVTSSVV